MSATGRGAVRVDSDRYMTPVELTDRLIARLVADRWFHTDQRLRVLEPHAGHGAFVRSARRALPAAHITANDAIDDVTRWYQAGCDQARVGDFLTMGGRFDLIIGNPPFAVAEAHVRHALSLLDPDGGVLAFLLRLGFLESSERIPFWQKHPVHCLYVLSERPSFTGGGTDASAYGLFVWQATEAEPVPELKVMSWRQP